MVFSNNPGIAVGQCDISQVTQLGQGCWKDKQAVLVRVGGSYCAVLAW
jgi:hypothetical protein